LPITGMRLIVNAKRSSGLALEKQAAFTKAACFCGDPDSSCRIGIPIFGAEIYFFFIWKGCCIMEKTKQPSALWAKEIEWDIDIADILDRLDEMLYEAAAEALEIPAKQYASMTTAERHDYAYDYFRGQDEAKAGFMGLPTEAKIPDSIAEDDYDAISDWLSDEYGFCHKKFTVGRKQIFTVRVQEVLRRDVTVEAENADDAEEKVRGMYSNEGIVLTSDDFIGEAEFTINPAD